MKETIALKKVMRRWVYASGLLFTLHIAFASYVNSSFISKLVGEKYVGLFFVIASIITIFGLLSIPRLTKTYPLKSSLIWFSCLNIILAGSIYLAPSNAYLTITILIAFYVVGFLIKYLLDLYLEALSDDNETGGIRGIFLVVNNLGWVISPLVIGLILGQGENYSLVYLTSGLALIPFVLLAFMLFKNPASDEKKEAIKQHKSLLETLKNLWWCRKKNDRNLHNILAIDFLLNFFYAFMVIYTPIYLHNHIGLPWSQIGTIFTVMLLPFVIFQYPLGWLADKKIGEKEIIGLGLFIMSLATIGISFISGTNLALWALVLFITRVGASFVEIGKEAYLFKNISSSDSQILGISRITLPLAYIVGPLCASIFLSFFNIQFIFVFIGLVIMFGLRYSLILIDTK